MSTHPHASALSAPDLSDAAFLRAVAGIRPCREGGLRLEPETLGEKTLIHNYGHGGCGVTLAPGCAERVANLIDELSPARHVAVLGSGVTALFTAYELVRRGRAVTLYADREPARTTSVVAGALWLPTGLDFPPPGPARDDLNAIASRSFDLYDHLAVDPVFAGLVETLPCFEPNRSEHEPELFEAGVVAPPESIPPGQHTPPGGPFAGWFHTYFMHTPDLIGALDAQTRRLGARFHPTRFASVDDIRALDEPVIVNCLALASGRLFGDDAVYPARGILVHMRPQPLGYVVHDGYRYLFPRRDALILGGTFEPGVDSTDVPQDTVRAIIDHHRDVFAGRAHEPSGASRALRR
ncbi:MAG: FAD-dependent oxidoreductase [Planctomycetota bacterium]